tara:strand:- start:1693 stop:1863 length:171 start_codon:yes stop_codon:yes gene_type:complete
MNQSTKLERKTIGLAKRDLNLFRLKFPKVATKNGLVLKILKGTTDEEHAKLYMFFC